MKLASLRQRLRAQALLTLAERGWEIRRTTGVRRTLPAVLGHYRALGLDPRTVIDVGVGLGTVELYDSFPDARLVLVEPLRESGESLEVFRRERGAEIIAAAAGPESGDVQIAVHRVPACSSLLGARRGDGVTPEQRRVPMVRLDDVVQQPGPYVLKIDVEGAELGVLEGAPRLMTDTALVLLEVSFFALVEGMPQFHDVVARMHTHGFVVGDIYNGHNRPLDGALAQVDVAFVQEHGPFRREHRYATPEQADALYRQWHL
jgi:FkbM family methyltransferase